MKRITLFLAAVIVVTAINSSVVEAAPQDDKVRIGRGRLLRKWRDDIFGRPNQPAAPRQNAKKAPTPAQPNKGDVKAPTQANRKSTGSSRLQQTPNELQQRARQLQNEKYGNQQANQNKQRSRQNSLQKPTLATPNQRTQNAQSRYPQLDPRRQTSRNENRQSLSPLSKPPKTYKPASPYKPSSRKLTASNKSSSGTKTGFGMEIDQTKDDAFVVTRIDSNGNAAEAGIRRGDRITEMGGAELTSLEEFEEISKLLGGGDQIEFTVARGGRSQKLNVQFGESDFEPGEVDGEIAPEAPAVRSSVERRPVTKDYQFVPAKTQTPYRSVLEPVDSGMSLTGPGN